MLVRRILLTALAWVAVLGIGRGVVALPEQCGPVTVDEVRASATAAVGWLADNQLDDGRWVYRYDREAETYDRRPHLVRHAGVTMSLYQAMAAGIPRAGDVADRGAEWALGRLVPAGDGQALEYDGLVPTGGSALLTAGLAVRKAATGDDRFDTELTAMGTFLASMVEPSGAVLAYWDRDADAPVPDFYSTYYTGETLWALSMLATVDPAGGWDVPAQRIARYVAAEQATAEDLFPPLSDHWAAYGLAQLQDGAGIVLHEDQRAYADRLAEIFSVQIRYESQRTGEGLNEAVLRGDQVLGAGLGTLGEGIGSLYRLAASPDADGQPPPGAGRRDGLAERAVCVASLLVDRQVQPAETDGAAHPDAVAGAWFLGPVTQMDDQQHALSALLLAVPAIDGGYASRSATEDPSAWRLLWLAVIVTAAANALRLRRAAAATPGAAAWGALAAFAVAVVGGALLGPPAARALDVSPATLLVGAGLLVAISAIIDLVRPRPDAGLPPWLGALRPAPVLAASAIGATAGATAGAVTAAGATAAVAVALLVRPGSGRAAVDAALARFVAAVAVVGGVDLLVHGIFAV